MPFHEPEVCSDSSLSHCERDSANRPSRGVGDSQRGCRRGNQRPWQTIFSLRRSRNRQDKANTELRDYVRSRGDADPARKVPVPVQNRKRVAPYLSLERGYRATCKLCTPEQLQSAVGYYPGEICKLVPEIRQKLTDFSRVSAP